jgi:hypothetical protein
VQGWTAAHRTPRNPSRHQKETCRLQVRGAGAVTGARAGDSAAALWACVPLQCFISPAFILVRGCCVPMCVGCLYHYYGYDYYYDYYYQVFSVFVPPPM